MQMCTACKRLVATGTRQCQTHGPTITAVETLPAGTPIGKYKIVRSLGEGGMGLVYEATLEDLDRRVAIKMLRPELMTAAVIERFRKEGKAANRVRHENIIDIPDSGTEAGTPYFVMEFLEGRTLQALIDEHVRLPLPLLLHVFSQIAGVLAAVHAAKIVHRDLKPENVYLVKRDSNPYFVKLLDFGIAQLRDDRAPGQTRAGEVMGTPQYMSPEQMNGVPIDARSDIWSLGVMLYVAATGEQPFVTTGDPRFQGNSFLELQDLITSRAPQPIPESAGVPPALAALIFRCLARRAEDRCASGGELGRELEQVTRACGFDAAWIRAAVEAIADRKPVPPRAPPRPASRGRWYAALAVGGLGAAALAVAGTLTAQRAGGSAIPGPPKPVIAQTPAADLAVQWRTRAAADLRAVLTQHDSLQRQGFAVDALALVHHAATVPLLTLALDEPADIKLRAARALGELSAHDAAPRLRAALDGSAGRINVEIAAALHRLRAADARAILVRASTGSDPRLTGDPDARLVAALALADSGDAAGRDALEAARRANPEGSPAWRRAVGGLAKLGDARARALLVGELAQDDAARSVSAAEQLARDGDRDAREQLARKVTDPRFAQPRDAALALAGLGDARALDWAIHGLASDDAEDRRIALGVCGRLAGDPATRTRAFDAVVKLAAGDPDLRVRWTAEAVLLGL